MAKVTKKKLVREHMFKNRETGISEKVALSRYGVKNLQRIVEDIDCDLLDRGSMYEVVELKKGRYGVSRLRLIQDDHCYN